MKIERKMSCDVFVIGAGISGILSSVKAAENKAKVIISSSSKIFSGSSFYPGTWGLGLIGPEDEEDEEDLIQTIKKVGCDMTDDEIVREFVKNINPSIEYIKKLGVKLKIAKNKEEKDFIPCFDHKKRNWNAVLFESFKEIFSKKMQELKIEKMEDTQAIDLVCGDGKIKGVILKNKDEIFFVKAKSVILATGGYSSLFKNFLTTDDVMATGHYMAYKNGCSLVNMEFMQMMSAYVSPCAKTVFNEKTFRYAIMKDENEKEILNDEEKKLLNLRSTYGPFTSRLESKKIDFKIERYSPVNLAYKKEIKNNMPEFIKTYFNWLYEKKHLTVNDQIKISIFSHASNGGIKINKDSSTKIPGLFACGEVTGSMHGADRIGGLSTANGLVFGIKAGISASKYAETVIFKDEDENIQIENKKIKDSEKIMEQIRLIMSENAMIKRNEKGLRSAICKIEEIEKNIKFQHCENIDDIAKRYNTISRIKLAKIILNAQLFRKESRGSHYREDFPLIDENMNSPLTIKEGKIYFRDEAYDMI